MHFWVNKLNKNNKQKFNEEEVNIHKLPASPARGSADFARGILFQCFEIFK